jgi:tetratricopeptide (TPR) repeat protein
LAANQNPDEAMALYGDYFFKTIQYRGTFLSKWPEWWFTWQETEFHNIRKAILWWIDQKDIEKLSEVFWNSWVSWWVHAHTAEAYKWAARAAEVMENKDIVVSDIGKARLWATCGVMAFWMKKHDDILKYLEKNTEFFFQVGDDELEASVLLVLGITATSRGDLDRSEAYLERCYAICEAANNIWGRTFALNGMARAVTWTKRCNSLPKVTIWRKCQPTKLPCPLR